MPIMNILKMRGCLPALNRKTLKVRSQSHPQQISSIFHHISKPSFGSDIKSQGFHSIRLSGHYVNCNNQSGASNRWESSSVNQQRRSFFSYFPKKKTLEEQQKADNVDTHYDLVYSGNSLWYIHLALSSVHLSAAAVGVCFTGEKLGFPVLNLIDEIMAAPLEAGCFITFSTAICLAIVQLSKQYPFRIYYSELENQFIVILSSLAPFSTRKVFLQPGELKPLPPGRLTSVLPWSTHVYKGPSQNLLLFLDSFKYPVYFNMLLGYQ